MKTRVWVGPLGSGEEIRLEIKQNDPGESSFTIAQGGSELPDEAAGQLSALDAYLLALSLLRAAARVGLTDRPTDQEKRERLERSLGRWLSE